MPSPNAGTDSETEDMTFGESSVSASGTTQVGTGSSEDRSPTIIELGVSVPALSDGESVTFTATVTDPDGPDNILGGHLRDPDGAITYGAFEPSGNGTYTLTLMWEDLHQSIAIDFVDQDQRTFDVVFFDSEANEGSESIDLNLVCKGFESLNGACDGVCRDLSTDSNCGSCGHACGEDVCDETLSCSACGNGKFQPSKSEQCDDGNDLNLDGCDVDCSYSSQLKNIALGNQHSCALTVAGGVKCWGRASNGILGYGNQDNIGDDEPPADVGLVDLGSPAEMLALGANHTCALLDAGLKCWGYRGSGQLGYGGQNTDEAIGDDEFPSEVGYVDVGGVVIDLDAGGYHTCAALESGQVRCWGDGTYGKLGYEDTIDIGDNEAPASVPAVKLGGSAVQVSVGSNHSCALLENGVVKCWGYRQSGQLGYADDQPYGDQPGSMPPPDVSLGGQATQITSGSNHNCALLANGGVVCWGSSYLGYPGVYTVGVEQTPAEMGPVQLGGPAVEISAGDSHTCALMVDGEVYCWGQGNSGALGYGNVDNVGLDETPAMKGPVKLGEVAIGVAAGGQQTCARFTSGMIKCWGANNYGQLGYGDTNNVGDGLNDTPDLITPVQLF